MISKKYLLLLAISPLIFTYWLSSPEKIISDKKVKSFNSGLVNTESFKIDIPTEKIDNFKKEIDDWKTSQTSNSQSQFFNNLTDVILAFDWKSHQHFLNTFKHYRMKINDIDIHFVRSNIPPTKNVRVVPLVLLHGFPGAFWDYYKIIPTLSNPSRHGFDFGISKPIIFDVIVPSLPGFLFSSLTHEQADGMNIHVIAGLIQELLKQLDVNDYIIHGSNKFGGDLAGLIASVSKNVKGVHIANPYMDVNYNKKVWIYSIIDCFLNSNRCDKLNSEKRSFDDITDEFVYELAESPIKTANYLMDAWRNSFSGEVTVNEDNEKLLRKKELNELFTYDELATAIYLYWVTDSLPTAVKVMKNSYGESDPRAQITEQPVGVSQSTDSPWVFNSELLQHKFFNITILQDNEDRPIKGGLFHYLQDPHNSVAHIFSFAETIFQ